MAPNMADRSRFTAIAGTVSQYRQTGTSSQGEACCNGQSPKEKPPRFVTASGKGRKKSRLRVTGTAIAHVMETEGKKARQAVPDEEHHMMGRLPGSRSPVQLTLASSKGSGTRIGSGA
jgi:hypothetical protein